MARRSPAAAKPAAAPILTTPGRTVPANDAGTSASTSYRIADALWLVRTTAGGAPTAPPAPKPTHHVFMCDVSGSMWGEVDKIKRQLKAKLATLVGPEDLVTLGYFASPGECGIIFQAEHVRGLSDLARLHRAIDKLDTLGCTCFVDPLRAMADVVKVVRKSHPNHATSGLFLSDGAHNSGGTTRDVIAACDAAAGGFDSFATVGYGWYAGMPLLLQMAERFGGSAIQAKDFQAWEPVLAGVLGRRPTGAPRVKVAVGDAIGGFVFAHQGGDLLTWAVDGGVASVPQDVAEVWWLSATAAGAQDDDLANAATAQVVGGLQTTYVDAAYAAVSLFARRINSGVVKPILRALGDVALAKSYAGAFGKQRTAAFADIASAAANGSGRYVAGYDSACVPRADAFTVLDLLALLAETGCRFFPDHEAFVYKRIGRARLDATDVISDDDLAGITAGSAADVQAQLDAIRATKGAPLKFVADAAPDGYAINGIVPASDEPNISLRALRTGHVDIGARVLRHVEELRKAGDVDADTVYDALHALPRIFPTQTFRNYAIVADGIVNVERLPVRLTKAAHDVLHREGIVTATFDAQAVTVIDLTALPVINEAMVSTLTAAKTLDIAYRLELVGAAQKVVKHYLKAWFPPASSQGMAERYDDIAAEWLKEQGLTDNGFNPKSVQAESKDVRPVRSLEVSFAGLSSLPKVDDVVAKMGGKGKMNAGALLMEPAIKQVIAHCKTLRIDMAAVDKASNADRATLQAWLEAENDRLDGERRRLLMDCARVAFTVIVAPAWFAEFGDDMGEVDAKEQAKGYVAKKVVTHKSPNGDIEATIRLREQNKPI